MQNIEALQQQYPGAKAWAMGDSPALANQLAALVVAGKKTATCGSLSAFCQDDDAPKPGSYHILLDGQGEPVCVIRIMALRVVRFCDVTEALARQEGEGDLSLDYWRTAHLAFFTRAGSFSEEMELVVEEFTVVAVL